MGLVVDGGLSDDQSDYTFAKAYTECVAIYEDALCRDGWERSG